VECTPGVHPCLIPCHGTHGGCICECYRSDTPRRPRYGRLHDPMLCVRCNIGTESFGDAGVTSEPSIPTTPRHWVQTMHIGVTNQCSCVSIHIMGTRSIGPCCIDCARNNWRWFRLPWTWDFARSRNSCIGAYRRLQSIITLRNLLTHQVREQWELVTTDHQLVYFANRTNVVSVTHENSLRNKFADPRLLAHDLQCSRRS
jgi:hypothetical protein